MQLRIINIIDSVAPINIGIWNSVLVNAEQLRSASIESELWFPEYDFDAGSACVRVLKKTSLSVLNDIVKTSNLKPKNHLIITHGLWHFPTRWGFHMKSLGFKWIFVPHGMLEPWPLQQKWLKKKIYFNFVEKGLARNADVIRAVSRPEAINLRRLFPHNRIEYLPNGVAITSTPQLDFVKQMNRIRYLFLSRLHHKKNVLALVQAWEASKLNNNPGFELTIAGPDQGELTKLQPFLSRSTNINYVGVISGAAKDEVLRTSTFYVLPSFSEGLPSALLEAMARGIIPIITEGCNFPDAFELNLAVKVTTENSSIQLALENTASWDAQTILDKSSKCRNLIENEFSLEAVTARQVRLYQEV
jgi:glycosyltransferase involved in cell wall biosynthesis